MAGRLQTNWPLVLPPRRESLIASLISSVLAPAAVTTKTTPCIRSRTTRAYALVGEFQLPCKSRTLVHPRASFPAGIRIPASRSISRSTCDLIVPPLARMLRARASKRRETTFDRSNRRISRAATRSRARDPITSGLADRNRSERSVFYGRAFVFWRAFAHFSRRGERFRQMAQLSR